MPVYTQSPNAVAAPKPNRWKKALITGLIAGLIIFAWNFAIRPALNGAGGVALDSALIEENIRTEYSNNGYDVSVECPDPMSGKVGEKRNCLVTNVIDGTKAMAVVTIENAQGAITWVAE